MRQQGQSSARILYGNMATATDKDGRRVGLVKNRRCAPQNRPAFENGGNLIRSNNRLDDWESLLAIHRPPSKESGLQACPNAPSCTLQE